MGISNQTWQARIVQKIQEDYGLTVSVDTLEEIVEGLIQQPNGDRIIEVDGRELTVVMCGHSSILVSENAHVYSLIPGKPGL